MAKQPPPPLSLPPPTTITNNSTINHQTMELNDNNNDNEFGVTSCGIGTWRPKYLQVFARPIFFLINLSLVGVIQSMNGPIFVAAMSTLEKRYVFDSKISGIILISDNISQFIISPIAGYLAVRYNRARLIAFSELFLAFSCFLTAAPYFIYGPAELFDSNNAMGSLFNQTFNQKSFQLCTDDSMIQTCDTNKGQTIWPAVFLLAMGSFFKGIGFTCFFVIGFPYLDDNVSKKNSPMYLSIVQSIRLIGPAGGYLLAAFCLRYYENPFVDPGITRKDPRFVGAWWLAFCIVGILLFFATLPLFLFPAQFANASVQTDSMKKKLKDSGGSIQAMKRFITNPVVMLYLFGSIFRYIGIGGYIMLKTKYIESQFRQSSSSASFITGTTSILPMAGGILLGGAFISVFRPSSRFILIYVFIVESVSIFTLGSGMFLGCDPLQMHGQVTNDAGFTVKSDCNTDCGCLTSSYSPLCGSDGQTTYFSPCFAGCKTYNDFNKTFEDCSCLNGPASPGYCAQDVAKCGIDKLFNYLIVVLTGAIISSTARTANALISFRSVDPMDKGFTMGAASSFMAIFAFIPFPLIFGYIADSACLIWETRCGMNGNCWLYDQEKFRYYLHGAVVFFMALGSIFDFIMIFFSDRIKNFYEEENGENGEKEANHYKHADGQNKLGKIELDEYRKKKGWRF